MELRQLEYFQTVARTGSISAAARELRVSQPSLSMTISRLEADLGVQLFDRTGGHITLNDTGRDMLKNVDQALTSLNEMRVKANDRTGTAAPKISFGVSTAGYTILLLRQYTSHFPNHIIRQYYQSRDNLRMMLERGELDFAISKGKISGPNIQWIPLMEEELYALVSPASPLFNRDEVHVSELVNQPFVLNNTDLNDTGDFYRLFSAFNQLPRIQLVSQESAVVMEAARQGLGVGLVSSILLACDSASMIQRDTKALRITGIDTSSTLGVARSKGRYLSSAAQQCFDFTQEFFREIATRL
jgi:DNA-binding transcriptional LysR family regulator